MSKLSKIKQGKNISKVIDFPGTDEKVAIAILSSAEIAEAQTKAEQLIEKHNIKDDTMQDIYHQKQILYKALRDKDDSKKQLADTFDEIDTLDIQEIQFLMVQYNLLSQESSPFLNSVTEEQFEELKKTLEKITWKDLNGPSLVALRNFLLSLVY